MKGHTVQTLKAADALLFSMSTTGDVKLLMVRRGDGLGWAIPGGMIEDGETPKVAALRELDEETKVALNLATLRWRGHSCRSVPDPRVANKSIEIHTTPFVAWIYGDVEPAVCGSDDAAEARWVPANTYAELVASVDHVFLAHVELLRDMIDSSR